MTASRHVVGPPPAVLASDVSARSYSLGRAPRRIPSLAFSPADPKILYLGLAEER
ncbi:hypothetical protein ACIBL3_23695 [Kribbella sp. NPDC050124]|uniref:hypothetical protein n=1 Tax=Kribbella sp. NPDC050124 TaxID=3364114 RepID=UPI00379D6D29